MEVKTFSRIEVLRFWRQKIDEGGMPAYNPREKLCKYRYGGKGCAWGVLIPHDAMTDDMDGFISSVRAMLLRERGFDIFELVEGMDAPTAAEIQSAHDLPARDGFTGAEFARLFFAGLRSLSYFASIPEDIWEEVLK